MGAAERIRNGDRTRFRLLFEEQYEPLCRFVLGYVRSAEAAEDLIQNVFLDLWRRRAEIDPDRSLPAYLYGAARNQALKHLRGQRIHRKWEEEISGDGAPAVRSPHDDLRDRELQDLAEAVMDSMPPKRRLIFTLSRHSGLTYAEIADILNISVKTVETQMGRALRFLRENLLPFLSIVA